MSIPYTPIVDISVNSASVSQIIGARLISVTVSDEACLFSDTLDVEIDDRDNRASVGQNNTLLVAPGDVLGVKLGYKETALSSLGTFRLDELTLEQAES